MKQTKTIPFDWEEYNNNRDKYKVVTRNGDDVKQLTKFEGINSVPLIGCCISNGEHILRGWQINGIFLESREQHRNDLQLQYEEEVVESWVNLYLGNDGRIITSGTYSSKESAKMLICDGLNCVRTINLNDLI